MLVFTAVANAQAIKKVKATDVRMMMDTSAKPLIVNFWATWCAPCVKEIPWFDSIMTKSNTDVKLLLVSLDFPESYPAALTAFVQQKRYKGEVVFLDESDAGYFCPLIEEQWDGAIPATIFIENKKKYKHFIGAQLTPRKFAEELDKLTGNENDKIISRTAWIIVTMLVFISFAVFFIWRKRQAQRIKLQPRQSG